MALAFLNRCGFRATSTGTGAFVVASALTGMQTPAQAAGPAVVNAATYRYFAQSDDLTQWEYGTGVYTTGDTTLTRATIYDNSSGGTTALSFSAAPQVRMGGALAQDMHWEVIGDTTISGATANVTHSLAYANYSQIKTICLDVQGEAPPVGSLKIIATWDGVNTAGFDSETDETGILYLMQEGSLTANSIFVGSQHGSTENGTVTHASTFSMGSHTPSGGTIDIVFTISDSEDTAVDFTAGRFITYGLRLPS